MAKEAVFTVKLEADLRDQFVAAAESAHRPASQVVRELMREFVERQRDDQAYDAFLRDAVERARQAIRDEGGVSDEEVEAEFAARRARV